MAVNKWIGIGYAGKDPEVRTFDNGDKIANLSLGVSNSFKNKNGEKINSTVWVNLVFRGRLVDVVEKYVSKGSHIYVEGPLNVRSYENKDGDKVYITEIFVLSMEMLGKKDNSSSNSDVPNSNDDSDDLPFL